MFFFGSLYLRIASGNFRPLPADATFAITDHNQR